jgi:hypothetical protein
MSNTIRSAADLAFPRFCKLLDERAIFRVDDTLTESDTRSKLIDPLFKVILGWGESEIRREKPVSKGYVDYVLGSDYNYLLIEAKRAKPRFQLSVHDKPRRLQLDGPHLLGNRKVKAYIHQAQGYASDLGVQFCLVTNGTQIIVFRPYLPGRSWRNGLAIVYHDVADIREHFADFYGLLARERVIAGSLVEAFESLEKQTTPLFSPIAYLRDPDRELVRNRVWRQIAKVFGPILTDQNDDPQTQLEVIKYCYVTTPLADQTDRNLDALLRDTPQQYLTEAKFVDLKVGAEGKTAFSHRLRADVFQARRGAYILTGGVGSGKTTFLKRFATLVEPDFVERYTAWFHIDFLTIGNVDSFKLDDELKRYVYQRMRDQLALHKSEFASDGNQIRQLFEPEISDARLTALHNVEEGSDVWNTRVNELVAKLYEDDERFAFAALRYLRLHRGRRIAMVLDNTDQLGETFQEKVFLLAQKLAADYDAICVVTLREEKFFAAYRRGIFDAFGDRRFHIGSPDLRQVLRKRLEYGKERFEEIQNSSDASFLSEQEFVQIRALLQAMMSSTTGQNQSIVRMLASVSDGDMRLALDMFREFLSSGNTNVEKIIRVIEQSGGYTVPFHEFAKSAILGSRRFYRSSVSRIVNVFKRSDALKASHFTACRILARLSAAEGVASAHGEGFVAVTSLLREYREAFGFAEDLVQWSSELLRRNLLESEPPRVADINKIDALRITAAGAYYWRYLVRSFAYVDLVFVDTPVSDEAAARKMADLAEASHLLARFERVRTFLGYLREREEEELAMIAERVGPFQEALLPSIRDRIDREIRIISRKLTSDEPQ